ncbi:hypothetical protein NPIL_583041 [Nephila pilipes]|uniref:C2H2-type domain-containing protein n=1 Tax=Nephila pilipes TaxID=299642 RepID=A0A8X6TXY1_NEPPI|nr:hypothetical protein NPIL_583041 [Nephila pilipes]
MLKFDKMSMSEEFKGTKASQKDSDISSLEKSKNSSIQITDTSKSESHKRIRTNEISEVVNEDFFSSFPSAKKRGECMLNFEPAESLKDDLGSLQINFLSDIYTHNSQKSVGYSPEDGEQHELFLEKNWKSARKSAFSLWKPKNLTQTNLSVYSQSRSEDFSASDCDGSVHGRVKVLIDNKNADCFQIFHCRICESFSTDWIQELVEHVHRDRSEPNNFVDYSRSLYVCRLCEFYTPERLEILAHIGTIRHSCRVNNHNHIREGGFKTLHKLTALEPTLSILLSCDACSYFTGSLNHLLNHSTDEEHYYCVKIRKFLALFQSKVEYCYCKICRLIMFTKVDLFSHAVSAEHKAKVQNIFHLASLDKEILDTIFAVKEFHPTTNEYFHQDYHTGTKLLKVNNKHVSVSELKRPVTIIYNDFTKYRPLKQNVTYETETFNAKFQEKLHLKKRRYEPELPKCVDSLTYKCLICLETFLDANSVETHLLFLHGANENYFKSLIEIEDGVEGSIENRKRHENRVSTFAGESELGSLLSTNSLMTNHQLHAYSKKLRNAMDNECSKKDCKEPLALNFQTSDNEIKLDLSSCKVETKSLDSCLGKEFLREDKNKSSAPIFQSTSDQITPKTSIDFGYSAVKKQNLFDEKYLMNDDMLFSTKSVLPIDEQLDIDISYWEIIIRSLNDSTHKATKVKCHTKDHSNSCFQNCPECDSKITTNASERAVFWRPF